MDAIAASAQVSKRTVYDHFGDKEQLFSAVVVAVVERAQLIVSSLTSRISAVFLRAYRAPLSSSRP